MTAVFIAGLGILACNPVSEALENPFEIVKTPTARIAEATSIVRVRIAESRPLTFATVGGGTEICGYHDRAETLKILDGYPVDRNFISNVLLRSGEEYVVAILDMRGKLPELVEHPDVPEDDRNFARCRDLYQQYVLGAARIVFVDGLERIDAESSDLVPRGVRNDEKNGTVTLSMYLEAIRRIREPKEQ